MTLRSIIIAVLLLMNFTTEPGFWEFTGFSVLGFLILLLTTIPFVGLLVVLGCGYLMFNYLHYIQDLHWLVAVLIGIVMSMIIGVLLGVGKKDYEEMNFPTKMGSSQKF